MDRNPESEAPAAPPSGRPKSQVSFQSRDIATADKADQPQTALAAAFREALARKNGGAA
jgi:hypothetical protein